MADVIDLIQRDHQRIRELFSQISETGPENRGDLFRHIVSELARHEAAEEAIIHPTLREEIGDERTAGSIVEEEQEAEELMAQMEDMDPTSQEFLASFRQLRDDVLEHAEHEENDEHPRLRERIDAARLQEMAEGFQRVKEMAPTHPHPNAPNRPEAQLLLGPIAGLFDRARDAANRALSS